MSQEVGGTRNEAPKILRASFYLCFYDSLLLFTAPVPLSSFTLDLLS